MQLCGTLRGSKAPIVGTFCVHKSSLWDIVRVKSSSMGPKSHLWPKYHSVGQLASQKLSLWDASRPRIKSCLWDASCPRSHLYGTLRVQPLSVGRFAPQKPPLRDAKRPKTPLLRDATRPSGKW